MMRPTGTLLLIAISLVILGELSAQVTVPGGTRKRGTSDCPNCSHLQIVCACKPCSAIDCPRECSTGYERDATTGCNTCNCKPAVNCARSCPESCKFGNVLDNRGCPTCVCKRQERCPPLCRRLCPNGFVKDRRGCPICQCKKLPKPAPKTKPGRCPRIRQTIAAMGNGLCNFRKACDDDSDCIGSLKCCGTCPRRCATPLPARTTRRPVTSRKPGRCPRPRPFPQDIACNIKQQCTRDSDCRGRRKCCNVSCAKRCVTPRTFRTRRRQETE